MSSKNVPMKSNFWGKRVNNVYTVDFENVSSDGLCLVADFGDAPWLWHRRLGHASFGVISKLSWHDLVNGLPKVKFSSDKICEACAKGKQTRSSFKAKNIVYPRPSITKYIGRFIGIVVISLLFPTAPR